MPLIYKKDISKADLNSNPNVKYVFESSEKYVGHDFYSHDNTFFVRTKYFMNDENNSYWRDDLFDLNKSKIDEDVTIIRKHLSGGGIVVLPLEGIGIDLLTNAPKTYEYLQIRLESLSDEYAPKLVNVT